MPLDPDEVWIYQDDKEKPVKKLIDITLYYKAINALKGVENNESGWRTKVHRTLIELGEIKPEHEN